MSWDCTGEPPPELMSIATATRLDLSNASSISTLVFSKLRASPSPILPLKAMTDTVPWTSTSPTHNPQQGSPHGGKEATSLQTKQRRQQMPSPTSADSALDSVAESRPSLYPVSAFFSHNCTVREFNLNDTHICLMLQLDFFPTRKIFLAFKSTGPNFYIVNVQCAMIISDY